MARESMMAETLRLLDARAEVGLTLPIISRETGLGLDWLKKVVSREIADPGVNRIETLLTHLRAAHKKGRKAA